MDYLAVIAKWDKRRIELDTQNEDGDVCRYTFPDFGQELEQELLPALAEALRTKTELYNSLFLIERIGPRAKDTIPALIALLGERGEDSPISYLLIGVLVDALGRMGNEAKDVIPLVIDILETIIQGNCSALDGKTGPAYARMLGRVDSNCENPAVIDILKKTIQYGCNAGDNYGWPGLCDYTLAGGAMVAISYMGTHAKPHLSDLFQLCKIVLRDWYTKTEDGKKGNDFILRNNVETMLSAVSDERISLNDTRLAWK